MSSANEKTKFVVEMTGRDHIEVDTNAEASADSNARVTFRGCTELIDLMQTMRRNFGPNPARWPMPEGASHPAMLLRELILKMNGQWSAAYKHAEVCHCRKVSTDVVDQAILGGAHNAQAVSRQTSASTACGTCRPDVEKMIHHRLHAGLPVEVAETDWSKESAASAAPKKTA